MAGVLVELPEDAKRHVDQQVAAGVDDSASAYILRLIEEDRRQTDHRQLRKLLIEGRDSGPGIELTDEALGQLGSELQAVIDEVRAKKASGAAPAPEGEPCKPS